MHLSCLFCTFAPNDAFVRFNIHTIMITQSNLITLLRGSFTSYELRVLVSIVTQLQRPFVTAGRTARIMSNNPILVDSAPTSAVQVELQMAAIVGDHTEYVHQAIKSLMSKVVEYYVPTSNIWCASSVIMACEHVKGSPYIKVAMPAWWVRALYDTSRGYTRYDADIISKITSAYAMRLYMMTNTMRTPVVYGIDNIRALFGLQDKYPRVPDLIKRVLKPAQDELAALGVNGFDYEVLRKGQTPYAIKLRPVKRTEWLNEQSSLAPSAINAAVREIKVELVKCYGFTYQEVLANKITIDKYAALPGAVASLNDIDRRARAKGAGKGYYINAMRSEIRHYSEVGKQLPHPATPLDSQDQ